MNCWAWCDIQTFELAVMQKISFDSGWRFSGGSDLNNNDILIAPCASNFMSSVSWGSMRHTYIRTCCDGEKFCRSKLFWIQGVRLKRLQHPVRVICTQCQMMQKFPGKHWKSLHSLISKSVLDKNHSQSRSGRERALSFKKRELKNTATVWFTIDCTFEINAVDNLASGDLVGISNTSALDSQAVLSFASQNSLVIGDQLLGSF